MIRYPRTLVFALGLLGLGISIMNASGSDWRTADRSSAGLAPGPEESDEAVIQIYAARTYGWRGTVAVHTWIATRPGDVRDYTVHQVVGWRSRRNLPVLASEIDIPDRNWFGNEPEVLVDIRGEQAERLIPEILTAVDSYPFAHEYTMWPGPNSNTFTAYVGRQVPDLGLDLPPTAIGKDYLAGEGFIASMPSGSGYQFSLFGLLGMGLGKEEGLEVNVLGLSFGINPLKLQLKLPGIGTLGGQTAL